MLGKNKFKKFLLPIIGVTTIGTTLFVVACSNASVDAELKKQALHNEISTEYVDVATSYYAFFGNEYNYASIKPIDEEIKKSLVSKYNELATDFKKFLTDYNQYLTYDAALVTTINEGATEISKISVTTDTEVTRAEYDKVAALYKKVATYEVTIDVNKSS